MAGSLLPIVDDFALLVSAAIAFLSVFRAVGIGRGLVNRVYRVRAYWGAALNVYTILYMFIFRAGLSGNGQPLYYVTNFIIFLIILVYIDSTVTAALEMDFFHRNTLRWKQMHLLIYPVFAASVVFFFGLVARLPWPLGNTLPQSALGTALLIAALGYSAVALAVGARRTPDRPMRRFVKLTSLLVVLIIAMTPAKLYISNALADLTFDALLVVVFYVGYLGIMSISPTARLEKG